MSKVSFSKVFLESGADLKITESVIVKHPKVRDILNLGNGVFCEQEYFVYVTSMLCDPYDNMIWLDDIGVDYEVVSPFDVFVLQWNYAKKDYLEHKEEYDKNGSNPLNSKINALKFFLGDHDFELINISPTESFIIDKSKKDLSFVINREIFEIIHSFIEKINDIVHDDIISPANEFAKKVLIDDMRREQRKKIRDMKNNPKDFDYIGKIVSGVIYGGNGTITPFNFQDVPIYGIHSSFNTIRNRDHYKNVMNSIYHGIANANKFKDEDLTWVK